MTINGFWPVFACGILGGVLGEMLKWYRLREQSALPDYAKSAFYWALTCLIVLAGGVVAVLYGTKDVNAVMALNVGLTAPLMIQSVASTVGSSQQQATATNGQAFSARGSVEQGEERVRRSRPRPILHFLSG